MNVHVVPKKNQSHSLNTQSEESEKIAHVATVSEIQESIFLTISQLSSMLQIKESHIRKMVFRREIPFVKIGRLVRFKKETIKQWLEIQATSVQK